MQARSRIRGLRLVAQPARVRVSSSSGSSSDDEGEKHSVDHQRYLALQLTAGLQSRFTRLRALHELNAVLATCWPLPTCSKATRAAILADVLMAFRSSSGLPTAGGSSTGGPQGSKQRDAGDGSNGGSAAPPGGVNQVCWEGSLPASVEDQLAALAHTAGRVLPQRKRAQAAAAYKQAMLLRARQQRAWQHAQHAEPDPGVPKEEGAAAGQHPVAPAWRQHQHELPHPHPEAPAPALQLPELLLAACVLPHLGPADLARTSCTCRGWRRAAEGLWGGWCARLYPPDTSCGEARRGAAPALMSRQQQPVAMHFFCGSDNGGLTALAEAPCRRGTAGSCDALCGAAAFAALVAGDPRPVHAYHPPARALHTLPQGVNSMLWTRLPSGASSGAGIGAQSNHTEEGALPPLPPASRLIFPTCEQVVLWLQRRWPQRCPGMSGARAGAFAKSFTIR